MLGIVPPITMTQRIGHETTSSIVDTDSAANEVQDGSRAHLGTGNYTSLSGRSLIRTVSPAPGTTSIVPMEVVPGPPLAPAEVQASLVPITPPSVTIDHLSKPNTTVYVPDDFIHLNVPYACPMCASTFRTVIGLTAHMNSPVHDPKEFFCPNLKCNRQFVVVSALIQHLESGRCGLASMDEIFERFGQITAGISNLLTV
jgi:hypothetical protein